ncbi:MAG: response regulator, partial [Trueperaceae bacterium]
GYLVVEASDGRRALELLERHPEARLLLTDIVMPGGLNGRQLADAARARRPDLPVLFTSGYAEHAVVHHGRVDPGVRLLTKPYRRSELAQAVHEALADRSAGADARAIGDGDDDRTEGGDGGASPSASDRGPVG